MLRGAEMVGAGRMVGPEDVAHDAASGVIYVGCADGWVKRVRVSDSGSDSAVEDWVNTGGRPLGLALGRDGEVIVCDAYKVSNSRPIYIWSPGDVAVAAGIKYV